MKNVILSAFAAVGVVCIAGTATQCDLKSIEDTLLANATIKAKMEPAQTKCEEDSGIDMFAITEFPTKETALAMQQSDKGCNILINIINGYTNINTQCTIEINSTVVTYGRLISDFLDGKTGNETDTSSDSGGKNETPSSAPVPDSNANPKATVPPTSSASAIALPSMVYAAIAAVVLHY